MADEGLVARPFPDVNSIRKTSGRQPPKGGQARPSTSESRLSSV